MNGSTSVNKDRYMYFHGKDVRTKKFQKKINRKPTLTIAILTNVIIILLMIFIIWLLSNYTVQVYFFLFARINPEERDYGYI